MKHLLLFVLLLPQPSTLSAQPATNCAPPPASLVAWWKAEGHANDLIGGNNGTLMNGAGFGQSDLPKDFSRKPCDLSEILALYQVNADVLQ